MATIAAASASSSISVSVEHEAGILFVFGLPRWGEPHRLVCFLAPSPGGATAF